MIGFLLGNWRWIAIGVALSALIGTGLTWRAERDHARAHAAEMQGRIDQLEAVVQANQETARIEKETADAKYESAAAAAVSLGSDLDRSVHDYESRLRARAVQAACQPVEPVGSGPAPQDPAADALGAALAACARDAARLDNAHEWAASLSHDGALPHP